MADTFDPYREALVMETETVWGDELSSIVPADRVEIERRLHAAPAEAASIEYVRVHTGFCRRINVTGDDLARVTAKA